MTDKQPEALRLAAPAQPVAQQAMAYAALPEPLEIDWPELHSQALGCGVEDRGLHNRYECAEYGWQDGVDKCAERVPEQIFDADQMRAFADATCAMRASHGQAPAGTKHDALPPLPSPDMRDVGTRPQDIQEFLMGYATEYARTALAAQGDAPVAELVTTAHGFETTLSLLPGHFDLPYGTHLLYAAPTAQPAPQQEAQKPFGYVNTSTGQFFTDVEPCRKNNEGHWRTVYTAPQPSPAAQRDVLDAERLDWLTFNLSGKALRDIGVVWSEHGDARRAIDAARAAQEGKSHDR